MSKKVNPSAVGIFVVGALVLLLGGLVLLGSGKLFEKKKRFVLYFQTSANGLEEGSAVQLGGVKVGTVIKMHVQFDPETEKKIIPVVVELSADRIASFFVNSEYSKDDILSDQAVRYSVDKKGLRATLKNKSALTGQLFVDLDFFPNADRGYRFSGPTLDGLLQIPTTPNEIERVLESISKGIGKLGEIDVVELVAHADSLLVDLNAKVNELDLKGISEKTNSTLDKIESTTDHLDQLLGEKEVKEIKETIANLSEASAEFKKLLAAIDEEEVKLAILNAADAMEEAKTTMEEIGTTASNITDLTDPNSASMVRLNRALSSIEETSRSLKDLTDFLKRNPNALISGKKRP